MVGLLDSVNQRTQLVGKNRLELLIFRLMTNQRFGINVFKVREVLRCPKLTRLPKLHPLVKGVANIRGTTISIIDLSLATGGAPITHLENHFVIISEFNRSTQGFLVGAVDRILNINWEEILSIPDGAGSTSYLTAVTKFDDELIELLDVEKILHEISPTDQTISDQFLQKSSLNLQGQTQQKKVLVIDDSEIAHRQINSVLQRMGYEVIATSNGREALDTLEQLSLKGDINEQIALIISDIEMPEMDGYTLTTEIRKSTKFKDLNVILYSSLSGKFNESMAKQVGANTIIAKFAPDELAQAIVNIAKN